MSIMYQVPRSGQIDLCLQSEFCGTTVVSLIPSFRIRGIHLIASLPSLDTRTTIVLALLRERTISISSDPDDAHEELWIS